MPPPDVENSRKVFLYMPTALYRRISAAANAQHRTFSAYVRLVLSAHVSTLPEDFLSDDSIPDSRSTGPGRAA